MLSAGPFQEYDGAGTLVRVYGHGQGVDEPLVVYEMLGGIPRRFLHSDHQGSLIALSDRSGNPVAVNAYDPWGIPNVAPQGRFGFTGQAWLPRAGPVLLQGPHLLADARAVPSD